MTDQTLTGSCLCGKLSYQVTGDLQRFYHCHCNRCQKATGTGHASNVLVASEAVNWTGDESLLKTFKVPDAERFSSQFCSNCGSKMPRHVPALKMVIIPAGSLDCEPGIAPQARIFFGSRASWSCTADEGLPQFDEYST